MKGAASRLVTVVFDSRSHYAVFPKITMPASTTPEQMRTLISHKLGPILAKKREHPGWCVVVAGAGGQVRDWHDETIVTFTIAAGFV